MEYLHRNIMFLSFHVLKLHESMVPCISHLLAFTPKNDIMVNGPLVMRIPTFLQMCMKHYVHV